jgi:hypothetical protein
MQGPGRHREQLVDRAKSGRVVVATLQEPLGEQPLSEAPRRSMRLVAVRIRCSKPRCNPGVGANIGAMRYIERVVNFTASRHREAL